MVKTIVVGGTPRYKRNNKRNVVVADLIDWAAVDAFFRVRRRDREIKKAVLVFLSIITALSVGVMIVTGFSGSAKHRTNISIEGKELEVIIPGVVKEEAQYTASGKNGDYDINIIASVRGKEINISSNDGIVDLDFPTNKIKWEIESVVPRGMSDEDLSLLDSQSRRIAKKVIEEDAKKVSKMTEEELKSPEGLLVLKKQIEKALLKKLSL